MVATPPVIPHPVGLTDNARTVLDRRYLLRGDDGAVVETPEQMLARVAESIASVEATPELRAQWAQRFYDEMAALRFLPNSPTLMNAGTHRGTLAACFVLPIDDTLESIMSTAQAAAMVQKWGGGTGFDFSRLRAEGEPIATTHGAACGPVSVLRHYDDVSRLVTQGGKRDGANMAILRIDHPDVRHFIHAKDDGAGAQRFNLSLAVTDAFIEAVATGGSVRLTDPHAGATRGSADAAALLDEITHSAWLTGDPGMVFIDTVNRANPTPALGDIEATNPCGEVPLLPWEACTLGSINVARFRDAGPSPVDWDALEATVALAVRFLDNVIDAGSYPLPAITDAVRGNRKIGLGVMGFHDLLIAVGIPYDSGEALTFAGEIMERIARTADETSAALGEEKGVFPNWERSIYGEAPEGPRYRNATRTCIAPTGTIAIIAGASSGIEPLYSLAHTRRMQDGTLLDEVSDAFAEAARAGGFHSPELIAELAAGAGIAGREAVPERVRRLFATAHEIGWERHVAMQAAFQRHTDLAVSKTVNLPHSATPEDVRAVFLRAHELGCKGVTVYRDGSRAQQVLAAGERASSAVTPPGPRRRLPDERPAVTHKFRVGEQEGYLTVGLYDDGTPGEVFVKIAKEGSTVSGLTDAIAILTSIALQYGVPLDKLAEKLEHTRFEPAGPTANEDVPFATSIIDYIFRWLRLHFGPAGYPRAEDSGGHPRAEGPAGYPRAEDSGGYPHAEGPAGYPRAEDSGGYPRAEDSGGYPRAEDSGGYPRAEESGGVAGVEEPDRAPIVTASGLTCPDCGAQLGYAERCLLCHSCGYTKCG